MPKKDHHLTYVPYIIKAPLRFFVRYIKRRLLTEYVVWGNESRLSIAPTAVVNNALFSVSGGNIVIEDYAFFGFNVSILTGNHDYRKFGLERQITGPSSGRDVIIKKGAWIASNVTIVGPCIIGENSVIGAGCLIHEDIPPNTICVCENIVRLRKIKTIP